MQKSVEALKRRNNFSSKPLNNWINPARFPGAEFGKFIMKVVLFIASKT